MTAQSPMKSKSCIIIRISGLEVPLLPSLCFIPLESRMRHSMPHYPLLRRREQRISRRGRTASLLLHPQPQLQGVLADLAEHLENFIQQRLLIIGDAPIGHDGP